MITLDKLKIDEKAIIHQVKGDEVMRRRLLDLGFVPGENVLCVLISPFLDPKAYKIRGNVIAIRNVDARGVEVEYEGD